MLLRGRSSPKIQPLLAESYLAVLSSPSFNLFSPIAQNEICVLRIWSWLRSEFRPSLSLPRSPPLISTSSTDLACYACLCTLYRTVTTRSLCYNRDKRASSPVRFNLTSFNSPTFLHPRICSILSQTSSIRQIQE